MFVHERQSAVRNLLPAGTAAALELHCRGFDGYTYATAVQPQQTYTLLADQQHQMNVT